MIGRGERTDDDDVKPGGREDGVGLRGALGGENDETEEGAADDEEEDSEVLP